MKPRGPTRYVVVTTTAGPCWASSDPMNNGLPIASSPELEPLMWAPPCSHTSTGSFFPAWGNGVQMFNVRQSSLPTVRVKSMCRRSTCTHISPYSVA